MTEEVTHLVYQNWTVQRGRVHVVGCGHYKKRGGGSGRNIRWYHCSSYEEARSIMNGFGYEDTGDCSCVFEDFVDELIKQSRDKGHNPKVFINMRRRYGTINSIKSLVDCKEIHRGLRRLQELRSLHLSLEAVVLKFPDKFTIEERETARWKLEKLGYDFDLAEDTENAHRVSDSCDEITDENEGEQWSEEDMLRALQEIQGVPEEATLSDEKDGKKSDNELDYLDNNLFNSRFWREATIDDVMKFIATITDIDVRDINGNTSLQWAVRCNRKPEVITLLLDRGANPMIYNHAGKIPFDYIKDEEHLKNSDIYLRLKGISSKSTQSSANTTSVSATSRASKPKKHQSFSRSAQFRCEKCGVQLFITRPFTYHRQFNKFWCLKCRD